MALKVIGIKTVTDNLNKWAEDRLRGIEAFNKHVASKVQTDARNNAPWQPVNQPKTPATFSGAARQGLTGASYRDFPKFFIALYHKVDYGKWLELANDGKFSIIEKTLNKVRLEWFHGIRRLLNKSTRI